jgi:hypothetical protein
LYVIQPHRGKVEEWEWECAKNIRVRVLRQKRLASTEALPVVLVGRRKAKAKL